MNAIITLKIQDVIFKNTPAEQLTLFYKTA